MLWWKLKPMENINLIEYKEKVLQIYPRASFLTVKSVVFEGCVNVFIMPDGDFPGLPIVRGMVGELGVCNYTVQNFNENTVWKRAYDIFINVTNRLAE